MARDRIGRTLIHSCGWIWNSRKGKTLVCPGCFADVGRGSLFVIKKKLAQKIHEKIADREI